MGLEFRGEAPFVLVLNIAVPEIWGAHRPEKGKMLSNMMDSKAFRLKDNIQLGFRHVGVEVFFLL